MHQPLVCRQPPLHPLVISVRLPRPLLDCLVETLEWLRLGVGGQSQPEDGTPACGDRKAIVRGALRATLLRIDCARISVDHELVKGILEVALNVGQAEQPARVGLVFREDPRSVPVTIQAVGPKRGTAGDDRVTLSIERELWLQTRIAPRPGVAKPQLR